MEHDITIIEVLLGVMFIWFSIVSTIIVNNILLIVDLLKEIRNKLKTKESKYEEL